MPLPNDDRDGRRRCRDCGEWKPLDEFHISSGRPSGRGSYCKPCFNKRSNASYERRDSTAGRTVRPREELPEGTRRCPDCRALKPLAEFPKSRSGRGGHGRYCKPCHNVRGRESRIRNHGSTREYHLRRRYGIGVADFERMLAEQGGVCAICGRAAPEHVDHDHVSGGVRGILCFNCNGGLGHFRDDVEHLAKAISYLRGTTPWVEISPGVYRSNSRTPAVRRSRII